MSDISNFQIEQDLTISWHFQREAWFRLNIRTIWSTIDCYLTVLDASFVPLYLDGLRDIFNKPTAVYFEQSAQSGRYDEKLGYPFPGRLFITAAYEAWRARCGDDLDLEYRHFLANPVRITPRGPKNLREIAKAHQALCDMAERCGLADKNHRIQPSYPAVVIVSDRRISSGIDDDRFELSNLQKIAKQHSVLIMRTGSSLGSEVSLDELDPHALPLDRADAETMDVRRVPLVVAVDFIVSLEARMKESMVQEYDDNLSILSVPRGMNRNVKNHPQTWVAAMMAARKLGNDVPFDVEQAIQRIEAFKSGVPCDWDFEHQPWNRIVL